MKKLVELFATSGYYPDTVATRALGVADEPWPIPRMTDAEFIASVKSTRLKAWPLGGQQNDPIYRDGKVIN